MTGTSRIDAARALRFTLWAVLILGWLVMLLHVWSAFATLPSAERLQESRMARIPTLRTVAFVVLRSGLELGALLALLLPWRPRLYTARLLLAALALPVWFIATAPLVLTAVEWSHRRWLAAVELALVVALIVYPILLRLRPPPPPALHGPPPI